MRVLGIELATTRKAGPHTLVALNPEGKIERVERISGLPAIADAVRRLSEGEPFLLGVDIPVVVPLKPAKARPVESLIRRRFRARIASGGRGAEDGGLNGDGLMAALATAGMPSLPYPDRDRRQSGIAETHCGLILKSVSWQRSAVGAERNPSTQEQLFRAWNATPYRTATMPARSDWPDQAVAIEAMLQRLDHCDDYDTDAIVEALRDARDRDQTEAAAALFDAMLIACTARRYLEAPESCLFAGERDEGYLILPADSLMRRLWLNDSSTVSGELFPRESLRDRIGAEARLRPLDLLNVPGRPERLEAIFHEAPLYEFDNVDEMMWWKHCRHLRGSQIPTNGLQELHVEIDGDGDDAPALKLVRSRHRALSFRFDRPDAWRRQIPTRDNRTYPFRVIRAIYETAPSG